MRVHLITTYKGLFIYYTAVTNNNQWSSKRWQKTMNDGKSNDPKNWRSTLNNLLSSTTTTQYQVPDGAEPARSDRRGGLLHQ